MSVVPVWRSPAWKIEFVPFIFARTGAKWENLFSFVLARGPVFPEEINQPPGESRRNGTTETSKLISIPCTARLTERQSRWILPNKLRVIAFSLTRPLSHPPSFTPPAPPLARFFLCSPAESYVTCLNERRVYRVYMIIMEGIRVYTCEYNS